MTTTGKLFFSAEGQFTGTSDGYTDDQVGSVNGDGSGASIIYADTVQSGSADYYDISVDPLNGLYFALKINDTGNAYPILTSGRLTGGSGSPDQGTQLATLQIPAGSNASEFNVTALGGFGIDPKNHVIYAGFIGNTDSDSGIYKATYDPSTGALTNAGLIVPSSPGHVQNPVSLFVDVSSQTLYYVDSIYGGPGGAKTNNYAYDNYTNGIYKVNLSNPTATPTELTDDSVFDPGQNNSNPVGNINSVTVNLAKGIVYFTTQDTAYLANNETTVPAGNGENALWEVSANGGAATKLATFSGGVPAQNGLTYDPVGNQLYDSDLATGHVVQFTLNAAGTAVTSTNLNFFTLDSSHPGQAAYENGLQYVDAPVLSGFTGTSTRALQGAGSGTTALAGTPTLVEANQGAGEFTGASVQITNAQSGDILAATTTGTSIIASYSSATHTLTLNGDDTAAHYAQVLASVTYQDTGTDASTGAHPVRDLTFSVSNGAAASTANTTIGIDRAPTATADIYTVSSGSSLTTTTANGLLVNDTDPDGDSLTATAAVAGTNSPAPTLNANGTFTEAPNAGYSVARFTYEASDGTATSAPQTVTIDFTQYDPKPVADTANVAALGTVTMGAASGVIANDVDPENTGSTTHLSLTGVSDTTSGAGTIGSALVGEYGDLTLQSNGSYSYTAGVTATERNALAALPMGTTGSDVFTYTETHTGGGVGTATLTITVGDNPPATTTHDVSAVQGGSAASVAPIDTDPDNDTLTVTAVNGGTVGSPLAGTYGSVTINSNDTYSYTASNSAQILSAATGRHPTDSFTYTVDDGKGGTATETLDIAIDRTPTLTDQSHAVSAAGALTEAAASGALAGDSDPDGDTLAVIGVTPSGGSLMAVASSGTATIGGSYGDLVIGADGHYTYTPGATLAEQQALASAAAGTHPADHFALTVGDNGGAATSSESLAFNLERAPATPTDSNAAADTVAEGAAAGTQVGVTASATDPDGDSLTYSLTGDSSNGGFTVNASTGVLSVADPSDIDYAGSGVGHGYTVTVQASDGALTSSKDFTVAVTDVDPTITGVQVGQATTDKSMIAPFADVVIAEPGSSTQEETVQVTIGDTTHGSFTSASLTASGFVADGSAVGQYDFTGTASEDTTAINQLVFSPTPNQVAPGSTVTTGFSITVGDGAASASDATTTVVATSVNDPPTITGTATAQAVDDNATATPFSAVTLADVDSPAQTQTVTVSLDHPTYGALSNLDGGTYDSATGVYSFSGTAAQATTALEGLVFTPAANQIAPGTTETEGFTVATNDGVSTTVSDNTTSVVITSVNDPPTITGTVAGQTVRDAGSATVTPFSRVTIGDVDTPAQTQTVTVTVGQPSEGLLSNLDGGTYDVTTGLYSFTGTAADATTALRGLVFTPTTGQVTSGESETESFTIAINDGTASTVSDTTTTVTITSAAAPPPPPPPPGGGGTSQPTTTDQGTAGNDVLAANAGGDTILGLAGDDTIAGGTGHDQLYGNAGNDVIALTASTDTSTVYGGMGNDLINASASTHANFLSGDLGNDSMLAGSGADTLYGGDGDDTLAAGSGSDQLYGNAGNDHISLGAASGASTVYAGQGDDVIDASASTHADFISADLGNDTVRLGSGSDTAYGGAGDDTLFAGAGHDQLYGNAGADVIVLGASNLGSTVYGGAGNDVIDASGCARANFISGDLGDDMILAGSGGDTIHGGEGSDTIQASSGAATYIHTGLGDSNATSATDLSELDHVTQFNSQTRLVFDGDPAATTPNTAFHGGDAAITNYAAAYAYAYGSSGHEAAIGGVVDYAIVSDTAGHVYVFAADHAAVEIDGLAAGVNGVLVGQILAV